MSNNDKLIKEYVTPGIFIEIKQCNNYFIYSIINLKDIAYLE